MKALLVNIILALAGVATAKGMNLGLTPESAAEIAGSIMTIGAVINQLVIEHHKRNAVQPEVKP